MEKKIYSIGHSNQTIESFLKLLTENHINCIVDIRSVTFSQHVPQFNENNLKITLGDHDIKYLNFSKEFGARRNEQSVYDNKGKVIFEKVWETPMFKKGVERLNEGLKRDYIIALMCSESKPIECHRFSMVSRYLSKNNIEISHILKNNTIIENIDLENELLKMYSDRISDNSIFNESISREEKLDFAFKCVNNDIAYAKDAQKKINKIQLFTIGFAGKTAENFFKLLKENNVKTIIDTRLNNKSQLAGFAKKDDLKYFAKEICDIDYVHMLEYAPSEEILEAYRKKKINWELYEKKYLELLINRNILDNIDLKIIDQGCLLCSEHLPKNCHRRLLAEYLKDNLHNFEIKHLI